MKNIFEAIQFQYTGIATGISHFDGQKGESYAELINKIKNSPTADLGYWLILRGEGNHYTPYKFLKTDENKKVIFEQDLE